MEILKSGNLVRRLERSVKHARREKNDATESKRKVKYNDEHILMQCSFFIPN